MEVMQGKEKRVGVVILTFNRISLLKIAVCKVLNQTIQPFEILVIDNASNDGTTEFLSSKNNITILRLEENSGPAGGFYEGIKYFDEKKNVDYVWLMDDDFFPKKDCLEELLKAANSNALYFPYVREKDLKSKRHPGWWGVLLPMEIIKVVKYPNRDLFLWGEDTEYLKHLINEVHKYSCIWVASAKGVHFTKREKNSRPPWRYYYEARNNIYVRVFVRKTSLNLPQRIYKAFKAWLFLLGGILLRENNKFKKLKFFTIGTFHGIFKKLGKVVEPEKLIR